MTALIAIVTYRRPSMLQRCIESVGRQLGPNDRILVIDNDPSGSGMDVANRVQDVECVIEAIPGIAAARNRAIEIFLTSRHSRLLFIDDDEVAREGWVEAHHRTAERYGAECTFGPVIPTFEGGAPNWVIRGKFFERVRSSTGEPVRFPATNNVQILRGFFDTRMAIRFDERFSLTGGSDTDFFERARDSGARFIWSDEAVVEEAVPPERAKASWIWRRGVRLGNVSARMLMRRKSRLAVAILGVCRMLASPAMVAVSAVRRTELRDAVMHLPKGVGMVTASFGRNVVEYARPVDAHALD
jgi:succinoglycan biosynthesis protein ExoM